jgi:hypothetical protein
MVVRKSVDESPDSSIARSKFERESRKKQLLTKKLMPCGFEAKGGEHASITQHCLLLFGETPGSPSLQS